VRGNRTTQRKQSGDYGDNELSYVAGEPQDQFGRGDDPGIAENASAASALFLQGEADLSSNHLSMRNSVIDDNSRISYSRNSREFTSLFRASQDWILRVRQKVWGGFAPDGAAEALHVDGADH
jgi:hypothetical protein